MNLFRITRRKLLVGTSGATALAGASGLWLGLQKRDQLLYRIGVERDQTFSPNVYLAIDSSGKITIWLTKSEMGQGVSTALPMLVAEELEADWTKISVEQAVTSAHNYGNQFTAASSSIPGEWAMLRRAGATAKEMLVSAAAKQWGVSESQCYAKKGVVYSVNELHQANYGSLASLAAVEWAPIRPTLKPVEDFSLIGTPAPRLDSREKSTGKANYGLDVVMPDLRYAVLARSPVFGGSLDAMDDQHARVVPGVVDVVVLKQGVAVVAKDTWSAFQGCEKLVADWTSKDMKLGSDLEVAAQLRSTLNNSEAMLAAGESRQLVDEKAHLTRDYELPYLAHMCMEPMNCTVWVRGGRCDIWVPSQAPLGARQMGARITGLSESNVFVHVTQLGGGFGRRASQDFVAEGVALALKVDGPVKLVWSREDDVSHGIYREASAHRMSAYKIGGENNQSAWNHRVVTATYGGGMPKQVPFTAVMGATGLPYTKVVQHVEWVGVDGPVPTGIWRSVGYSYNTFVVESFVDELATDAGIDPLAYRQSLIAKSHPLQNCLAQVAVMAEWRNQSERHLGVACLSFGSTQVAMIIEVEEEAGDFNVTKAWCAIDCGIAVNPNIVKAQVEGGLVDGLSAAMFGRLEISGGAVQQSNFSDYPLARISDAPLIIEVNVVDSTRAPSGVGEAALPAAAPAFANALFKLTGKRFRKLPFSASMRQVLQVEN